MVVYVRICVLSAGSGHHHAGAAIGVSVAARHSTPTAGVAVAASRGQKKLSAGDGHRATDADDSAAC